MAAVGQMISQKLRSMSHDRDVIIAYLLRPVDKCAAHISCIYDTPHEHSTHIETTMSLSSKALAAMRRKDCDRASTAMLAQLA